MNVTHKPVNHTDTRGEIRDIFPRAAPECVTLITSGPGAVRGNHLHERSTQHTYVVFGSMLAYSRPAGATEIECRAIGPGDLLRHDPGEAHAFVAQEYTVFLAFAEGLRKGDDYEKDTIRLPSLVAAYEAQSQR